MNEITSLGSFLSSRKRQGKDRVGEINSKIKDRGFTYKYVIIT
jgi:hypothetical protein